ncbi:MAG: bifunctional ornithine acetyltransferase/N-acetylglutamate synthase [Clostridiales bacterium]|nr:bifunctional ornithine acetyltransferase/N-acetylglutamate synthase [Clostridiales bacterium]
MKFIPGSITAPKGFLESGIHCGIRKNKTKRDLALIMSEGKASAAAVYTTNRVKGAPLLVTRQNIEDGYARAVICNSGNANTCNADGEQVATEMCELVAQATGISAKDVIVASTGVIGQRLDITPIKNSMSKLVEDLSKETSNAAEAIMTTDTVKKEVAVEFELSGVTCRMGAIAKGSGMIHPNMATMLIFITCDVAISPEMLQKALSEDIVDTFNMISVDGDTSTNDMVSILANGYAGNPYIDCENKDFTAFKNALKAVTTYMCRQIAADGEGATKLLVCEVKNAADKEGARKIAKSVICSSLFKAAMFGADANWGRVLCAIGYSGVDVDVNKIDVSFCSNYGEILVCENGAGLDFSEEIAKKILSEEEVITFINLKSGTEKATAWGCDLTYDYVKINGDYRT